MPLPYDSDDYFIDQYSEINDQNLTKKYNPGNVLLIITSILYVISFAGQAISLPLFTDSFKHGNHHANPYFVLLFSSFAFYTMFTTIALYRKCKYNSNFFGTKQQQYNFFIVGLFNALFGILVVNSSPNKRTPADLQAILAQSIVPYTFLLSYLLKKEVLETAERIGAVIVCLGILISLIPIFVSISHIGKFSYTNLIWCFIFLIGMFPAAACNVYQDKVLKKYEESVEVIQLLSWSSLYQLIIMLLTFWLNFTPLFGTSDNYSDWKTDFLYSFDCYFRYCPTSWYAGLIFIGMYIGTYVTGGILLKYASANFTTLLSSISVPCAVTFWILFPSLTDHSINTLTIVMNYVAVVIIVFGVWKYTTGQKNKPLDAEIDHRYIITDM